MPTDMPDDPPVGRLLAVLIGVNDYDHLHERGRLRNAVNDVRSIDFAIRSIHAEELREVRVLAGAAGEPGWARPTKANILDTLADVARAAGPHDTVLIYFAGHGELHAGETYLLPQDATGAGEEHSASMLSLAEVGATFSECRCTNRLLLLDACNSEVPTLEEIPQIPPEQAAEGVRARGYGMYVMATDEVPAPPPGWAVLHSCSPDELSWERGDHGCFSQHVVLALRGKAARGGSGTVTLGDLLQFVTSRVSAYAEEHCGANQTPAFYARGVRTDMPITPGLRIGSDAALADRWRRTEPGPDFLRLVLSRALGRWGMEDPLHSGLFSWGAGLIFAGLVLLLGVLFGVESGGAAPMIAGGILAVITLATWLFSVAWAVAAAVRCWHWGGYIPSIVAGCWLPVALLILLVAGRPSGGVSYATTTWALLVTLGAVFVTVAAHNALNIALSLEDIIRRGEPIVIESTLREFHTKLMNLDIPNVSPFISASPAVYVAIVLGVAGGGVLAHAVPELVAGAETAQDALMLLGDALLLLLALWFAGWYPAVLKMIERRWSPPA